MGMRILALILFRWEKVVSCQLFIIRNNPDFINAMIGKCDPGACMLVCNSNFADDATMRALCASAPVSHIMVLDPQRNRSLDRYLKGLNKT